MTYPYVSDQPLPNSYYVASVVGNPTVECILTRESAYFSTFQQAIAFKQDVEKEFKDEVFIVVDTAVEMC